MHQERVMSQAVFALPVSVEQLATAIRQMSAADRQRLLILVPELRQEATQLPLVTMQRNLPRPYCQASLPQVMHPEDIDRASNLAVPS